ncbi:hypothetical protein BOX15_Mlig020055g1 [Macrostomum lignano]|uniref:Uncharacterized protein n=1 Tax=Macrostomum lignano TaxID=282301 RepID=A0A267E2U1_9PLAT|nr:hypothetical protein BOX15_Mlig020055g1 [Macrostomum lignano]
MPKSATLGSWRTHGGGGSDQPSGSNAWDRTQICNPYDQLQVEDVNNADTIAGDKNQTKPLQWSIIFINMASLSIAAYILTSGVIQLITLQLGICLCSVTFAENDASEKVTWLVASCLVSGPLRLLVSVCVGRPAYNRRIWPSPSRHRSYLEQLSTVALVPDVDVSSRDMSVLDREQLVAGTIHPAFYYRTLLIAWQEGLLSLLWILLHLVRLVEINRRFPAEQAKNLVRRDELLEQLFASAGSNYTSVPLKEVVEILGMPNRPSWLAL